MVDNQIFSNMSVKVNGIVVLFCGVLFCVIFVSFYCVLVFDFAIMCYIMSLPTVYGKFSAPCWLLFFKMWRI